MARRRGRDAKAMLVLRDQVDKLAPRRYKGSDGTEASSDHHRRNPTSDHEAKQLDTQELVVSAIDITHDPRAGCDCNMLVQDIIDSRDPRIKYIIWNRRIISGSGQEHPAWVRRSYGGSNPHTMHAHFSLKGKRQFYDDVSAWDFDLKANPEAPVIEKRPTLRRGSRHSMVRVLQELLGIKVDGVFGARTEAAVRAAQRKHGLTADGVAGRYTWQALEGGQ